MNATTKKAIKATRSIATSIFVLTILTLGTLFVFQHVMRDYSQPFSQMAINTISLQHSKTR